MGLLAMQQMMMADLIASDPYFANNVFLLPLTGSDGSTTITDIMGGTWTAFGDAQIDTGDTDFPGGSLQLDGAGDYIKSGTIAGLAVGTGPFTLDGWIKLDSTTTNKYYFDTASGNRTVLSNTGGRLVYYDPALGISGQLYNNGPTAASIVGTRGHVAITREAGGTVRGFWNGVKWGEKSVAPHNKTDTVAVIGRYETTAINYAHAHMGPLRFANACRWTADFTPPPAPFLTS